MEEIWNYNVCLQRRHGAISPSGAAACWNTTSRPNSGKTTSTRTARWKLISIATTALVHVITTGASYVDKMLWVSTYFGCCRYDGRHWRGYFDHDCGLPSNFINNLKARSGQEAWFCTDKGLGACMDAETCTWVTYTCRWHKPHRAKL